jgi:NAD(P)-dependent dehydrogenase (short-subunit alcohol dehydrogenase family)
MSTDVFDLSGKVALVTGAGARGGLGHAMAVGLATAGADVLASDIDREGGETTAEEIRGLGRRGVAAICDNSQPDDIRALFATLDREFGYIDILINNAGIGARKRPEDLSLDEWHRVLSVSLTGTFVCSIEAGKRMISRGRGGSIVNISSIAGSSALGRGNLVHSVAKSGVNQLTRELAVEWGPHRIRVNAIQPAQIRTTGWGTIETSTGWDYPAFEQRLLKGIPLGRLGEPADLVGPAIFLASDASAFVSGHLLAVDGGNLALNAGGHIVWPAVAGDR